MKKNGIFVAIVGGVLCIPTNIRSMARDTICMPGLVARHVRDKAREECERQQYLAEVKGDIDQKLIRAAYMHDEKLVQRLIEAKANVNAADKDGITALMNAVSIPSVNYTGIPIAQMLIKTGADVKAKDDNGITTFMYAAVWGNVEMAQLFINAGFDDIDGKANDGRTALLFAAQNGCKDMVKMLLWKGVNVNTKITCGDQTCTALTCAARYLNKDDPLCDRGYEEIVKDLMEAGAEIDNESIKKYPEIAQLISQKFNYYLGLMKKCVNDKAC